ncbi:MAG TPA: hypothetical protein PK562_05895, partial [Candidatus Omnitrophota bacterium]|nr:hypothetical protein [Candidatus Omnitrophota bacterium]
MLRNTSGALSTAITSLFTRSTGNSISRNTFLATPNVRGVALDGGLENGLHKKVSTLFKGLVKEKVLTAMPARKYEALSYRINGPVWQQKEKGSDLVFLQVEDNKYLFRVDANRLRALVDKKQKLIEQAFGLREGTLHNRSPEAVRRIDHELTVIDRFMSETARHDGGDFINALLFSHDPMAMVVVVLVVGMATFSVPVLLFGRSGLKWAAAISIISMITVSGFMAADTLFATMEKLGVTFGIVMPGAKWNSGWMRVKAAVKETAKALGAVVVIMIKQRRVDKGVNALSLTTPGIKDGGIRFSDRYAFGTKNPLVVIVAGISTLGKTGFVLKDLLGSYRFIDNNQSSAFVDFASRFGPFLREHPELIKVLPMFTNRKARNSYEDPQALSQFAYAELKKYISADLFGVSLDDEAGQPRKLMFTLDRQVTEKIADAYLFEELKARLGADFYTWQNGEFSYGVIRGLVDEYIENGYVTIVTTTSEEGVRRYIDMFKGEAVVIHLKPLFAGAVEIEDTIKRKRSDQDPGRRVRNARALEEAFEGQLGKDLEELGIPVINAYSKKGKEKYVKRDGGKDEALKALRSEREALRKRIAKDQAQKETNHKAAENKKPRVMNGYEINGAKLTFIVPANTTVEPYIKDMIRQGFLAVAEALLTHGLLEKWIEEPESSMSFDQVELTYLDHGSRRIVYTIKAVGHTAAGRLVVAD